MENPLRRQPLHPVRLVRGGLLLPRHRAEGGAAAHGLLGRGFPRAEAALFRRAGDPPGQIDHQLLPRLRHLRKSLPERRHRPAAQPGHPSPDRRALPRRRLDQTRRAQKPGGDGAHPGQAARRPHLADDRSEPRRAAPYLRSARPLRPHPAAGQTAAAGRRKRQTGGVRPGAAGALDLSGDHRRYVDRRPLLAHVGRGGDGRRLPERGVRPAGAHVLRRRRGAGPTAEEQVPQIHDPADRLRPLRLEPHRQDDCRT